MALVFMKKYFQCNQEMRENIQREVPPPASPDQARKLLGNFAWIQLERSSLAATMVLRQLDAVGIYSKWQVQGTQRSQ